MSSKAEKKLLDDLSELEAESEQMVRPLHPEGDLRLRRPIQQQYEVLRRMARGQQQGIDMHTATASKAQHLHAGKLNVEDYFKTVESIDMSRMYSLRTLSELDVTEFLNHEYSNNLYGAIDECTKITSHMFQKHFTTKMEEDWARIRDEAIGMSRDRKSDALRSLQGGAGTPSRALTITGKRKRERPCEYARLVEEMNKQTLSLIQLVKRFGDACRKSDRASNNTADDSQQKRLEMCWTLLHFISKTTPPDAKSLPRRNRPLLLACRQYNEANYREHIGAKIEESEQARGGQFEARPAAGGAQNPLVRDVRAYIKIVLSETNTALCREVENAQQQQRTRIWPLLFYCLRCGDRDAALAAIAGDRNLVNLFQSQCPNFLRALGEPPASRRNLSEEYQQQLQRGGASAFMAGCYTALGVATRYETIERICPTFEDYLWGHIALLEEAQDGVEDFEDGRRPRLRTLQENIHGKTRPKLDHFEALLVTLQFERAIRFLIQTDLNVEAVHFAILLDRLKVLRTNGSGSVDLEKIVSRYVQTFERSDPRLAFHYLLTLSHRDRGTFSPRDHSQMRRLLINPGSRAQITRQPDLLEKYLSKDRKRILEEAADGACKYGDYRTAVDLYARADEIAKAVAIVVQTLTRVLSKRPEDPTRKNLVQLVRDLQSRNLQARDRSPLQRVAKLAAFFTCFHTRGGDNLDRALEIVGQINLLPTSRQDIRTKLEAYLNLDGPTHENFAHIVEAVMKIYYQKQREQRHYRERVGPTSTDVEKYRRKAGLLCQYVTQVNSMSQGDEYLTLQSTLARYYAEM